MKNIKLLVLFPIIILLCLLLSCKKYLDAKPDQKLAVPSSLKDLELLVDQLGINNQTASAINVGTDEYYVYESNWNSLGALNKRAHIWDPQLQNDEDWNKLYLAVYQANTILDNLKKISAEGQLEKWNNIKGMGLFLRAHAFYQIAQVFAPQFDNSSASNDLGIPLRLNSDFNIPTIRSSVQQTYDQIISDLNEAVALLSPNNLPTTDLNKARPNIVAAYGLLARIYLIVGNYSKAKDNADLCLQLYSTLIDYNTLNQMTFDPVLLRFNPEVVFYTSSQDPLNVNFVSRIDSNIYNLFSTNDTRKNVFFRTNADGTHRFKGNYNGLAFDAFNGIATDEIYLIRAECYARAGNIASAMNDLNDLLINRFNPPFIPVTASTADDALIKILEERRKELIYRGTRWTDLRRLNKDSRFQITIKRILGSQTYTLSPNDKRYTLLIPQNIINLTGIQQNPR